MSEETRKPTPEEKAKAAAEARAKAEALRKQREEQAAQANAAASADSGAKAEPAEPQPAGGEPAAPSDDAAAKAKAAAAAKAKAAAAAAAAAKAKQAAQKAGDAQGAEAEEKPKPPSKNQPYLDKYVKLITGQFGADAIEDAYINELAKEVPTLVIRNDKWHDVARFLKEEKELAFDYLSNLHGVDYDDRMEVYYHFYSYENRQSLAVKVKTDREQPTVSSVSDIWSGADWNERETFDLLGIHFPGHKNLRRIMMPDNWVGHPLRKDYVPYDEEV